MVTEADGTVLFSRALPVHTMRQIISFCRQRGLYCQFYQDHKILVEKVTEGTTIDPDLANTQAIEAGNFDDYNLLPSPKAMIVARPESVPHIQTCLARLSQRQRVPGSIPALPDRDNACRYKQSKFTEIAVQQAFHRLVGGNGLR